MQKLSPASDVIRRLATHDSHSVYILPIHVYQRQNQSRYEETVWSRSYGRHPTSRIFQRTDKLYHNRDTIILPESRLIPRNFPEKNAAPDVKFGRMVVGIGQEHRAETSAGYKRYGQGREGDPGYPGNEEPVLGRSERCEDEVVGGSTNNRV